METLRLLSNFALLIGLGMYGWASFFRRVRGAPGVGGGGRHLPWQRAEWFTPAGYRIRFVGFILWSAGAIGIVVTAVIGR